MVYRVMNFVGSAHCKSHGHCFACRNETRFRESLLAQGSVQVLDFECPEGHKIGQRDGLSQPVFAVGAVPLEKSKWPAWMKALGLLARPGERGIGDIVARTVGPLGGDAFKRWYKNISGKDCDCPKRQAAWNRRYPL